MERQTGKPIDVQKEKEKRKKKSVNLGKVFKDGIFSNNPVFEPWLRNLLLQL